MEISQEEYNKIKNFEHSSLMDKDEYDKIAEMINSEDSPVGIDAKKTHVIIIHKLNEIEKRLSNLEREKLDGGK